MRGAESLLSKGLAWKEGTKPKDINAWRNISTSKRMLQEDARYVILYLFTQFSMAHIFAEFSFKKMLHFPMTRS